LDEKFPEFRKSLIILDGDKSKESKLQKHKNVLFLPGLLRPENVFLEYLDNLPKNDKFWSAEMGGYDKPAFLMGKPSNTTDRATMKDWFNKEKQHWGLGGKRLFNRWVKDNQLMADKFCEELTHKIEQLKS